MLLWSNETIHCNSVLHCNCNYLKIICRKLIFAHLSRIVSNKIWRVFSHGIFLQKKSATWKVFVFSTPAGGTGLSKLFPTFQEAWRPWSVPRVVLRLLIIDHCWGVRWKAEVGQSLPETIHFQSWSSGCRRLWSALLLWCFFLFCETSNINILLKMIWLRDGIICLSREQCTFQGDERDSISDEFYHQEIKECSLV